MNNEYQIKQFMEIIDEAGEMFSINKKGYLYTTVNTPYTVSSYNLKIDFYGIIVQITTECPLNADPAKVEQFLAIRNLFDSLNSIIKSGEFHIMKERRCLLQPSALLMNCIRARIRLILFSTESKL